MNTRRQIVDELPTRYLLLHPESNSLFETDKERTRKQSLADGCEDVTGNPKYEAMFAKHGKYFEEAADQPYHVKYRPKSLADVVGQPEVVKSLESMLKGKSRPHSFLFTGPSGTGKTTLARILASEFGVAVNNTIEVDAATHTGIDAMRTITETLRYAGMGETPNKIIVIDECHALSKAAWQSLLKSVEEPPPHIYFAFCTTDPGKVPDTIKTRCHSYSLKPVRFDDVMDMLERIADLERLKTSDAIISLVGRSCDGSPRQALVMLSMVKECESVEEAASLLEAPLENKEIIDLCRLLLDKGLTWAKLQSTLTALPDQNPESIRIVVANYLSACLIKAKNDREVPRLLDILYEFSRPFNTSDKLAPVLLAFGSIMFR